MLASAPCSLPWSDGPISRVISPCMAGPDNPLSATSGTPAMNHKPLAPGRRARAGEAEQEADEQGLPLAEAPHGRADHAR